MWYRLKSPASPLFTQSFIQTQIKENIKAPRHWPLCGEFTGDRWIPRTNGQLRGKCFHLMTSSCTGQYIIVDETSILNISSFTVQYNDTSFSRKTLSSLPPHQNHISHSQSCPCINSHHHLYWGTHHHAWKFHLEYLSFYNDGRQPQLQLKNLKDNTAKMFQHVDGLVQERRNSIVNALESRLSCTNPST